MKLNKIGGVWNSANRLKSDFIGFLSSKHFDTMATLRNDLSSLWTLCSTYLSEINAANVESCKKNKEKGKFQNCNFIQKVFYKILE